MIVLLHSAEPRKHTHTHIELRTKERISFGRSATVSHSRLSAHRQLTSRDCLPPPPEHLFHPPRLCSPSHRPHRPSLIYSRPSNHSLSLLALSTVSPTSISLIRPKMSCVSWIDTSSHPVHDEHRTSPRPRPNDQTFRFASTRDLERTPRPRDPDRHILHKPQKWDHRSTGVLSEGKVTRLWIMSGLLAARCEASVQGL